MLLGFSAALFWVGVTGWLCTLAYRRGYQQREHHTAIRRDAYTRGKDKSRKLPAIVKTAALAIVATCTVPAFGSIYIENYAGSGDTDYSAAVGSDAFTAPITISDFGTGSLNGVSAGSDLVIRATSGGVDTFFGPFDYDGVNYGISDYGFGSGYDYNTNSSVTGSSADPLVLAGGTRQVVPEPASLSLCLLGSTLLCLRRREASSAA